ncbi:MAG: hypothetical protein B6242_10745 [Anaerolineaceae bacterium 4572_78]|nr:MAG: hypothetical protein B6242_10745 [Anaerolineaceae bacterium 4572_78]
MIQNQLNAEVDTVRLDLPAIQKYASILSPSLEAILDGVSDSLGEKILHRIQLALYEACTNIIKHAYKGKQHPDNRIEIILAVEKDTKQLMVDIYDTGESFDIAKIQPPENKQEHGWGLFLIKGIMDKVAYTPTENGNHWHLVKKL